MCADVGRQELQSSGQYLRGMRVKIFVIFLLASSCAAAQAQTHQERKVRRLLAKGKAYPAIRIASGVLGKNTHPEFYALRAEGYNSISEFTKAEADARTAIRLLPDSVGGLFQLARRSRGWDGWTVQRSTSGRYCNNVRVLRRITGWPWWNRCGAILPGLQGRSPKPSPWKRKPLLHRPACTG